LNKRAISAREGRKEKGMERAPLLKQKREEISSLGKHNSTPVKGGPEKRGKKL